MDSISHPQVYVAQADVPLHLEPIDGLCAEFEQTLVPLDSEFSVDSKNVFLANYNPFVHVTKNGPFSLGIA